MVANEETAELIKKSNKEVFAYQVDLTKREEIYKAAAQVKGEVGQVLEKMMMILNLTNRNTDNLFQN